VKAVALDLFLDVQSLDRKPIIDWEWVRSLNMKKFRVQVEGICKPVCRIDAHDQGAMVQFSQFHTPVAAVLVFPTPPFPLNNRILISAF